MRSVALTTLVVAAVSPQQPLVTTALSLRGTERSEHGSNLLTNPSFTVHLAKSELMKGAQTPLFPGSMKLGVTLEKNEIGQWVLSEVNNEKLTEAGVVKKQQPLIKVGNKEISDAGSVDEVAMRIAEELEGGDGVVDVEFERRIFATDNAVHDAPAPPEWRKVANVSLMDGRSFALHARSEGEYAVSEVKRAIQEVMGESTRGTSERLMKLMGERLMKLYVAGHEEPVVNDVSLAGNDLFLILQPARVLIAEDVQMARAEQSERTWDSRRFTFFGEEEMLGWKETLLHEEDVQESFKVEYDRVDLKLHFVAKNGEEDYTVENHLDHKVYTQQNTHDGTFAVGDTLREVGPEWGPSRSVRSYAATCMVGSSLEEFRFTPSTADAEELMERGPGDTYAEAMLNSTTPTLASEFDDQF